MTYTNYTNSRDAAWQLLIDIGAKCLPIRISDICKKLCIPTYSYRQARSVLVNIGIGDRLEETDGFTFGGAIFFDNERCSLPRQRFTVAHELGHIVLGHAPSLLNREPEPEDAPEETAANVFASRLLAPACVLWGCGVCSPEEISTLCDISLSSAEFRWRRLELLYKREELFMREHGRSCFLLHRLEQQVYTQFEGFITAYRRCRDQ